MDSRQFMSPTSESKENMIEDHIHLPSFDPQHHNNNNNKNGVIKNNTRNRPAPPKHSKPRTTPYPIRHHQHHHHQHRHPHYPHQSSNSSFITQSSFASNQTGTITGTITNPSNPSHPVLLHKQNSTSYTSPREQWAYMGQTIRDIAPFIEALKNQPDEFWKSHSAVKRLQQKNININNIAINNNYDESDEDDENHTSDDDVLRDNDIDIDGASTIHSQNHSHSIPKPKLMKDPNITNTVNTTTSVNTMQTSTTMNNINKNINTPNLRQHQYQSSMTGSFDPGQFDGVVNALHEIRSFMYQVHQVNAIHPIEPINSDRKHSKTDNFDVDSKNDSDDDDNKSDDIVLSKDFERATRNEMRYQDSRDPFDTDEDEMDSDDVDDVATQNMIHDNIPTSANGQSEYEKLMFMMAHAKSAKSKSYDSTSSYKSEKSLKSKKSKNKIAATEQPQQIKSKSPPYLGINDDEREHEKSIHSAHSDANSQNEQSKSKHMRVVTPVPVKALRTSKSKQRSAQSPKSPKRGKSSPRNNSALMINEENEREFDHMDMSSPITAHTTTPILSVKHKIIRKQSDASTFSEMYPYGKINNRDNRPSHASIVSAGTPQSQTSAYLLPTSNIHKPLSPSHSHTEMSIDNEDNYEFQAMSDGGMKRLSQSYKIKQILKNPDDPRDRGPSRERSRVDIIMEEEDEDIASSTIHSHRSNNKRKTQKPIYHKSAQSLSTNTLEKMNSADSNDDVHNNNSNGMIGTILKQPTMDKSNSVGNLSSSTNLIPIKSPSPVSPQNVMLNKSKYRSNNKNKGNSSNHSFLISSSPQSAMARENSMVVEYDERSTFKEEIVVPFAISPKSKSQNRHNHRSQNGITSFSPKRGQRGYVRKHNHPHKHSQEEMELVGQPMVIHEENTVKTRTKKISIYSPREYHSTEYMPANRDSTEGSNDSGSKKHLRNHLRNHHHQKINSAEQNDDEDEDRHNHSMAVVKHHSVIDYDSDNNRWTKWIFLAACSICFILGVFMGFGISWLFFVNDTQ